MDSSSPGGPYIIYIRSGDPQSGNLDLSDGGVSSVKNGTVIQWIVQQGAPNVQSITNIGEDNGSIDVFAADPRSLGHGIWQGTVKPNNPVGAFENYFISWVDTSGNGHTFDPKIVINA